MANRPIFMEEATRVSPDVSLGEGVELSGFCNLYGCNIGNESRIGPFVEIQRGVVIGQRCKISSHSFLCEGVTLGDGVFIGHGVMFTNDRYPAALNDRGELKTSSDWRLETTTVGDRAAIGSGSTILCGLTIGDGAMVGAGSVVTEDVPAGATVAGNPARALKTNPPA